VSAFHSAFGLRIQANIDIPGFLPLLGEQSPDVIITLGGLPDFLDPTLPPNENAWYADPELDDNGVSSCRIWKICGGDYFRFFYEDGTDCVIDRHGTRVWICWPEAYGIEDVMPYLQGQLLGLVQRLRGVTCLHASAIVVGDRAIAIAGPKGRGKSSTAAAFLKLGFPVLADDVVPVFEEAGKFMVRPAHSRLCLCPDMVETLYGSSDALPQFAPSWEKRYVNLNVTGPGQPGGPVQLGAVYILGERADEPDRPMIAEARAHDAMLELLCNTYINHLLDPEMRSREFVFLSRLHQSVPLRVVHPHEDATRIFQLCQTILDDFASHRVPSSSEVPLTQM
jgi:hypothetical protein